ncbi:MAG: glutamine--fructose-6-phosphate transaminase (isomerizing), partial [Pseudomonadota bacterium]|nr:glutamine--fructose-6-phosphate transaminase (isomerizing) [Pseudomonadota bacterium]
MDSLKRLEYRGYDSSGIVTQIGASFSMTRAVGKLSALSHALRETPLVGRSGIGHTRWATHGGVSERNAHPHIADQKVAIVHNGIIENHVKLRTELEEKGNKFASETDSEVLAHLFLACFNSGMDARKAGAHVLSQIEGTFAFAAMHVDQPDVMIVGRNASPLAIGIGEGTSFVGSDAVALAHLTRNVIYLKDNDYAVVTPDGAEVFDADGKPVNREVVIVAASQGMVDKGGYRHFMEKEIHEQPDAIAHTLAAMTGPEGTLSTPLSREELQSIDGIVMLAAGTSHYAAMVARYWIEALARVPVSCEVASEYRYRKPVTGAYSAAVAISQSGESLDTLMAMRHAGEAGLQTIGLVNVPESTIAREADLVMPTRAGPEIGVASTKAFTAQLTALICFAIALAEAKGEINAARRDEIHSLIQGLPSMIGKTLALFDEIRP